MFQSRLIKRKIKIKNVTNSQRRITQNCRRSRVIIRRRRGSHRQKQGCSQLKTYKYCQEKRNRISRKMPQKESRYLLRRYLFSYSRKYQKEMECPHLGLLFWLHSDRQALTLKGRRATVSGSQALKSPCSNRLNKIT